MVAVAVPYAGLTTTTTKAPTSAIFAGKSVFSVGVSGQWGKKGSDMEEPILQALEAASRPRSRNIAPVPRFMFCVILVY